MNCKVKIIYINFILTVIFQVCYDKTRKTKLFPKEVGVDDCDIWMGGYYLKLNIGNGKKGNHVNIACVFCRAKNR
jgi:hypothetical protein